MTKINLHELKIFNFYFSETCDQNWHLNISIELNNDALNWFIELLQLQTNKQKNETKLNNIFYCACYSFI